MERCKPIVTPLVVNEKLSKDDAVGKPNASVYRSLIESMMYLYAIRPDIMYSASLLSRFMQSHSQVHYTVAKRVLRYIRGTFEYGPWFLKSESGKLQGLCRQ